MTAPETLEFPVQDMTHSEHWTPQIVYEIPRNQNPVCIWDNGPTQRTGSCFTCLLCGSTTSCG